MFAESKLSVVIDLLKKNGSIWMMLYAVEKLIGASGKRWRVDYEVKKAIARFQHNTL